MLLRLSGYQVDVCTHSDEVLALIEQSKPDVVLLDLGMPKICGLDIAEELKDCPDIRPQLLAAVTGFDTPEIRSRATAVGFDAFFTKPVEFTRLKQLIEKAVRIKQST